MYGWWVGSTRDGGRQESKIIKSKVPSRDNGKIYWGLKQFFEILGLTGVGNDNCDGILLTMEFRKQRYNSVSDLDLYLQRKSIDNTEMRPICPSATIILEDVKILAGKIKNRNAKNCYQLDLGLGEERCKRPIYRFIITSAAF